HEFHIKIIVPKEVKEKLKGVSDKKTISDTLKPEWDKTCYKCHKPIQDEREYIYPGHTECAECHATEITNDCLKCHSKHPDKGETFQHETTGELIFNHKKHAFGSKVNLYCTACHPNIPESKATEDNNLPSMWDCRDCHGGAHSKEKEGAKWDCAF